MVQVDAKKTLPTFEHFWQSWTQKKTKVEPYYNLQLDFNKQYLGSGDFNCLLYGRYISLSWVQSLYKAATGLSKVVGNMNKYLATLILVPAILNQVMSIR